MQSKNWCCKPSLSMIRRDLLRFWPVWASYLAVWCLLLVIPLLNLLPTAAQQDPAARVADIHRLITDAGGLPALIVSLLYGGIASFAVWSYLCQSRSASLYHALPLTRESLFLSHFAAGLGFLWLPNLLAAVLSYLCQLSLGYADPRQLLIWLSVVCLEGLLFFSIGTLAAMLTGSLPAVPVLYALLNFAVVACEALMSGYACMLYYGVEEQPLRLRFLSPFVDLVNRSQSVPATGQLSPRLEVFDGDFVRLLCFYALTALVLSALALLLYRRRATESAGDVIAVPPLRPAAKYLFAFACSLTLGWVFLQVLFPRLPTAPTLFMSVVLGGAVGYLMAAMLLKKSFRVFSLRQLLGFVPLALVLGCWVLSIHLDLLGVERRVPAPEEISGVTIYSEYSLTCTEPDDLALIRTLHQASLTPEEAAAGENQLHFRLEYALQSGEELNRSYLIPYSAALADDPGEPAGLLKALMSQPEHIIDGKLPEEAAVFDSINLDLYSHIEVLSPDKGFSGGSCPIDPRDGEMLVAAMREDVLAGHLFAWNPTWGSRDTLLSLSFGYRLPGTGTLRHWKHVTVWLDEHPTRTLETLVELGYLTEVPHE